MKYIIHRIFLTVLFLAVLAQIGAQNTNVRIARFDKDFFQYLEKGSKKEEQSLQKTYPDLLPAFFQIAQNNNNQTVDFGTMKQYFAHTLLKTIYRDEMRLLADLTTTEQSLNKASVLIAKHFPTKKLPRLAIHVSGFKENIIYLDTLISISGDKYLGSDYKNYQQFFSARERFRMQPKAIARDLLKAWIIGGQVVKAEKNETLLSAMIYEGKILFLLSKLLPEYSKSEIGLFMSADVEQFSNNKKLIWDNIVKNRTLFSTDRMQISGFIDENPRSLPISGKTPPQTGAMIGWEIVEQYAAQTGSTLQQILNADATTILKTVRYNP